MNLMDYFHILSKRKWTIIMTTLVTLAVAIYGSAFIPRAYEAKTTLRVLTTRGGSPDYVRFEIEYADRLMNTYKRIAGSGPVLQELRTRLNLRRMPEVNLQIIANTELMEISAKDPNPELAMYAANTLAEILLEQSQQDLVANTVEPPVETEPGAAADVQPGATVASSMPTVTIVEPAELPNQPTGPGRSLFAALGLMVGLAAGVGLAFVFENIDTRLYTKDQVEADSGLPVLGEIPVFKSWGFKKNNGGILMDSFIHAEQFWRLRTQLFSLVNSASLKSLLITSADAEEGKSTIAANLAISIAQTGKKVLVIDVDMRRPTLHKIFRLSNAVGLTSILTRKGTYQDALSPTNFPNLYVLPSGPPIGIPANLLGSEEMVSLFDLLKNQFELILLDAPAFLAVSDSAVLSSLVDGVLVIVKSGQTQTDAMKETRDQLLKHNVPVTGIVLNSVEEGARHRFYNSYYTHVPPAVRMKNSKKARN